MDIEKLDNKRIAKNTLLLYVRMIFLMAINLYTSRIVLKALGVDDYGVYNVVGGFVGMFGFLSGALSSSISRFLMFELGKSDLDRLKSVFSTSILIMIIISIIIIAFSETLGLWFLNTKLNIPAASMTAANWVYQFSLLTFIINLLSVPYNASIIAHERMGAFAYIGIFEGIANLGVAMVVLLATNSHLIYYSALTCGVAIASRLIYTAYCKRKFEECIFQRTWEKALIKEMFGFTGWNFIGNFSGILRSQGLNILFNIYYGPVVNAARGLSVQIETAVVKFTSNFFTAVQPQITKSIARENIKDAYLLAFRSSRLAFFLLTLLCLPIIFNIDFILNVWLTDVPARTSSFVIIILLFSIVETMSHPLIQLILAYGKVRTYQIVVGGIVLLNFPLAWILLYLGASPEIAQASVIFISLIALFARVRMLKKMIDMPAGIFFRDVVLRCLIILSLLMLGCYFLTHNLHSGWFSTLLNIGIIELFSVSTIFFFGLSRDERLFLLKKLHLA